MLTNSVLVFSDLLIDRSSNYKFDVEKFTNTEGKTAIYIQYTRVRIKSILKNINKLEYFDNFDKTNLTDAEINLILSILKFSNTFKRSTLRLSDKIIRINLYFELPCSYLRILL